MHAADAVCRRRQELPIRGENLPQPHDQRAASSVRRPCFPARTSCPDSSTAAAPSSLVGRQRQIFHPAAFDSVRCLYFSKSARKRLLSLGLSRSQGFDRLAIDRPHDQKHRLAARAANFDKLDGRPGSPIASGPDSRLAIGKRHALHRPIGCQASPSVLRAGPARPWRPARR